jgi:hypothetical protein
MSEIEDDRIVWYVPNPYGTPDRYHLSKACAGGEGSMKRRFGECDNTRDAEPCGNCMSEITCK